MVACGTGIDTPGPVVDSAVPHYEFPHPDHWKEGTWTERFPGSAELRKYFAYVVEKCALCEDIVFDCFVKKAVWDDKAKRWLVTAGIGERYHARFFSLRTDAL
jgi:cation diffusion facilitator CzcD-associated flavoprotein CzcO